MAELYADIVVPVARDFFTFRAGEDIAASLGEGMGVAVQLGPRKRYMGIVWRIHAQKPAFKVIRNIEKIVYPERVLSAEQMDFWEWVSQYYMCTLGEVMRFAIPAALKPTGLSEKEFERDEFRPREVKFVSLAKSVGGEKELRTMCESLGRARAQYKALMEFCSASGFEEGNNFAECSGKQVRRDRLAASDAVLKKLEERGILSVFKRELTPAEVKDSMEKGGGYILPRLTVPQSTALGQVRDGLSNRKTVLLHGVTGSGKTEIYTHLIADELDAGRSVLYMMPEIAMTSQLVARIKRVFGDRLTVYHSRMTDRQRAEAYRKLSHSGGGELILGVRSSVLLPLPQLGLIIVDEEHDQSYKQAENQPRYNARDCAVYMAGKAGAKCLLASATPSIESFSNGSSGKYGLVTLSVRYGEAKLPEVIISDTLKAVKRGERKAHFNKILLDSIKEILGEGRQAMLFQNRRAFSPYIECGSCGWTGHCPRCSVTLSYHRHDNSLRCHLCGFNTAMYVSCPKCGVADLQPRGFGTEKVEDELAKLFPKARIARLDRDTSGSARRFEKIIGDFEAHRTDILVGTQMITKGFDFPGVSLVGILNADNLLNYPDFRASERAYQIMTQMAGRAGRSDSPGRVIIQTSQPDNPLIINVRDGDYAGMVNSQLAERAVFGYPPYGKLVNVILKHRNKELLEEGASYLAARMREIYKERVYGPHAPLIEKISDENILTILLKIESGRSVVKAKELLGQIIRNFSERKEFRPLSVSCDVDPQ